MKTRSGLWLFGLALGLTLTGTAVSAQTTVSLTFDDGLLSATTAQAILDAHGMKGTFYIISGLIGTDPSYYLGLAPIQAIQADGHEIGGHTITHPDLPTLTTAQQQHEICDGRTQLVGLGFNPTSFAYPYGDATSTTEAIVKSCYASGRGAWCNNPGPLGDCTELLPPNGPADPYWIQTPDAVQNTTTVQNLKDYVTAAEGQSNGWVTLQFHFVGADNDPTCGNGTGTTEQYCITRTNFTNFIIWLQSQVNSGAVAVKTVGQVMGAPQNPAPTLTSLNPGSANQFGPGFTLQATGSNFVAGSVIRWNGTNLSTTFLSSTTMTAPVPASQLLSSGTVTVTVFTPAPGGGLSNSRSFTVLAATSTSTLYTIWGNTSPGAGDLSQDPSSLEIGVRFRSDVSGSITGIRFYKWSFNTGTHIGNLWTNTGTLLASATFTGETASGWQTVSFPTPVAISSNTLYVASYFTTKGYAVTTNYFTVSHDNPPLHAPMNTAGSPNGLYLYNASSAFPTQNNLSSNYWVDVMFTVSGSTGPASNPVPTLASISPSSTTVGGSSFTLTLNGSNFISSSTVRWNGSARSTTFVTNGRLTASIPASDLSSTGTINVTVFSPAPGGGTSGVQTFTILAAPPPPNPIPTLAGISPSTATAGGAAFTLTLTGGNFISSSTVRWNGLARTTTYVSSGTLRAAIPASDIVSSGTATITVFNPAPGGGASNVQTFTMAAGPPPPNPVPILTSLAPSSATVGGSSFTLTLNGSNFISSSTVQWNGSVRPNTFVNSGRLTASIPASDLASTGTASVTVFNPGPGGGTSSGQTFTINPPPPPPNPTPTLTSLSPSTATAGGPGFTLTVNGANFISTSTVRWNGSARTTSFINSTTLTASIPAADIAATGSATVTVFTPTPGGGTSAGQAFTINASTISAGPWTIWSSTVTPGDGWQDPSSLEIGVRFRSDLNGYITGIRFYKDTFNTGTHTGHLWTNTGTLLGTVTFTGETASGWQTAYFATPVAITANTTYVASYFTTTGYSVDVNYFASSGVDHPPLHALKSGVDGLNGLYLYGASSAFPTQSTNTSNYWVDVVFNTTPAHGAALPSLPLSNSGGGSPAFIDFSQVREYPNPWRSDRPNNGHITFDQLPPSSTVKIFTISAHWVKTLDATGGSVQWDLTNDAGDPVASGFYIYLITSNGGKTHGTLAIIR